MNTIIAIFTIGCICLLVAIHKTNKINKKIMEDQARKRKELRAKIGVKHDNS